MKANTTYAIGVMSGTSLDGLDIAFCRFDEFDNRFNFQILYAETIHYPETEKHKLANAHLLDASKFIELHIEFGTYIGKHVQSFMQKHNCNPDLIASHGHTIVHNPKHKITFQIGSGAHIYAETGIKTVNDFRCLDVALGGEGAPLVPLGDKLLFHQYESALNLGGFSNITFLKNNLFIASDICPVNILLNTYAYKLGNTFDKGGELGRKGKVDFDLLDKLNKIDVFKHFPRHSLSREWVESQYISYIDSCQSNLYDIMRTLYEHIASEIAKVLQMYLVRDVIITGGGAYNRFLLELIEKQVSTQLIVPDNILVEYKEALIFALLGTLRVQNKINVISEITGAVQHSSSGTIWG
jgi:anhydro-N-acetylmuramic acid kinase